MLDAYAQALSGRIGDIMMRVDAWQNALTGLGTLRDKTKYHEARATAPLNDAELQAMFDDDDIASRIIEQLPADAVRQGFRLKLEQDDTPNATTIARDIVKAVDALQGLQKLREAWIWGRLFNLGAVFVGAEDGQDPSLPLNVERVEHVRFLNVLRRTQLRVDKYYTDVRAPKYGEPELFEIVQQAGSTYGEERLLTGIKIHESRMLIFRGVMTAREPVLSGSILTDHSVLQRCKEALQYGSQAWMSATHLMSDASQGVLHIQNLIQMLSTNGEGLLKKRMQMMDLARSVCRSILVDADKEKFERVPTSFQGLPDMLDRQMMRISAAARMPLTILFGRSPAGMNATGESDTRSWYDQVATERAEKLDPKLRALIEMLMRAKDGPTSGKVLDGWEIQWNPLWQPTDKEQAETFKLKADALAGLVTAQVVQPEEAALKLAHDGGFAELDVESREHALEVVLERVANPPSPEELMQQQLEHQQKLKQLGPGGGGGDGGDDPSPDDPADTGAD